MQSSDSTDQMIGQMIKPTADRLSDDQLLSVRDTPVGQRVLSPKDLPSYRLEKLLVHRAGKRTFLATEIHSNTTVVVELILFGQDLWQEAIHPPASSTSFSHDHPLDGRKNIQNLEEPSKRVSYIDSFEVKTPIGEGLALVKPFIEASRLTNSAHHTPEVTNAELLPNSESLPSSTKLSITEPYYLNLSTPYRRAYTLTPQMSFSDFKIRATPDKLEIHCLQHRIRENLEESYVPPLDGLELGALTAISTIVFVGGSVALSGSILLGFLIAAALPIFLSILLRLIAFPPPQMSNRKAILRLTKGSKSGSKHRALLSLTTLPVQKKSIQKRILQRKKLSAWGTSSSAVPLAESKLHFSQVTVSAVKLSPVLSLSSKAGFICYQVSFLISDRYPHHDRQLRITGTYPEMKWLSHHLSQWGNRQNR